jgi:sigma-B regulation protein RsbU (phosphoserine phosphatase)
MTTAAVVAYYRQEAEAKISYAGHPPVLYKRVADKSWAFARPSGKTDEKDDRPLNIPLAVASDTFYGQTSISMATGDRLFVYTDGIIDAPSPKGKSFGLTRLKDVLDENMNASHSELKAAVLRALDQYTKKNLSHDDITMIVLEIC